MEKRTPIFFILMLVVLASIAGLVIWKWDTLVEKIAEEQIDAERQAWMQTPSARHPRPVA